MNKRIWGWIFLCSTCILLIASLWFGRHQFTVLTGWKQVEGTLQRYEVVRNHDGDGILYFQTRALFQYIVDGKEQSNAAQSYFGSTDYGWIARQFYALKATAQYPIYYNPAKPEIFEFGAGFNTLYFKTSLQFLAAAFGCAILSWLFLRLSRAPKRCPQCRKAVRSFFRYCPDCGESISLEPHRMQT